MTGVHSLRLVRRICTCAYNLTTTRFRIQKKSVQTLQSQVKKNSSQIVYMSSNAEGRTFLPPCNKSRHNTDRLIVKYSHPFVRLHGFPVLAVQIRSYVSRKDYKFPEILETDLEEDFVRGSGPGGQAVNQTANCVVLKHTPSGIVIKCHETRSLEKNRERARERLKDRLDLHLHGSNSFLAQQEQEMTLQRQEKKMKNRARLEMKKAFKEREGLD